MWSAGARHSSYYSHLPKQTAKLIGETNHLKQTWYEQAL